MVDFDGTVVAITHDRYFLDNAAGWILELDRGRGIPFEGNYSTWLEAKEKRLEQEQKSEEARQKTVKSELEWVRQNAKGRQVKSKARLKAFEELQSQDTQKRNETQEIYIPPGPRLGDKVIEFRQVSKAFDDKMLIDDLSFAVPAGAIVGVIGGNGAGKSTLFKIITGQETPDSGTVEVGDTVQMAYVDQSRDTLDGSKTVWAEVSDEQDIINVGNYSIPSRAYLGRFNFKGGDQQKFVKDLSGGERNRLHLSKTLKQGGNVLLLDEPTNDLDVETLRALEEALLVFRDCPSDLARPLVSGPNRYTHILAYEGDSQATFFEGNYSEYEEERKKRLGGRNHSHPCEISSSGRLMARSWPYIVLLLPRCSGPVISSLGERFRPISAPSPCLFTDGYWRLFCSSRLRSRPCVSSYKLSSKICRY